ncbi:hypothetical protein M405DRAFT_337199 [Rhizopogon salebrosus TDB-379]|nr:hypothetical protein M405DRAFT_337199 [Rhizopogon salebrosus TDB-379]
MGRRICSHTRSQRRSLSPRPAHTQHPLSRWLRPLIKLVQSLDLSKSSDSDALDKTVEANIIIQVHNLCESEPITQRSSSLDMPQSKREQFRPAIILIQLHVCYYSQLFVLALTPAGWDIACISHGKMPRRKSGFKHEDVV